MQTMLAFRQLKGSFKLGDVLRQDRPAIEVVSEYGFDETTAEARVPSLGKLNLLVRSHLILR